MIKKLIEIKNKLKKKKPDFKRQDSHKKSKLGDKWRRPKGLQSKLRLGKRGHAKKPSQGYRSPVKVRGHDRDGLLGIRVSTVKELEALDPKTQKAVIASTVGQKKMIIMLEAAVKKNIAVKNYKDPKKKLEEMTAKLSKKKEEKEEKKKKEAEKKAKKKDEKPKAETKKSDDKKESTEEDKKAQEKKEKDKILTKKE